MANTIDEVIKQLDDIILRSKNDQDPLGYFAALYRTVTVTVRDKLGKGYFDDDARMEKLDVVFASRYLKAYADYKEGKPVTKSWENAFTGALNKKLIVLQHLLLGMNAHINLDLGIAAVEVTTVNNLPDLKDDFNRINEILSSLVNEVQNDLARIWPFLLKILKLFKNVDDFLIDFSMTLARDGAWKFATELSGQSPDHSDLLIEDRDKKIAELADSITDHGFAIRFIFWIIRLGEKGNPATKIEALE